MNYNQTFTDLSRIPRAFLDRDVLTRLQKEGSEPHNPLLRGHPGAGKPQLRQPELFQLLVHALAAETRIRPPETCPHSLTGGGWHRSYSPCQTDRAEPWDYLDSLQEDQPRTVRLGEAALLALGFSALNQEGNESERYRFILPSTSVWLWVFLVQYQGLPFFPMVLGDPLPDLDVLGKAPQEHRRRAHQSGIFFSKRGTVCQSRSVRHRSYVIFA